MEITTFKQYDDNCYHIPFSNKLEYKINSNDAVAFLLTKSKKYRKKLNKSTQKINSL